jgi:hypothetical protein
MPKKISFIKILIDHILIPDNYIKINFAGTKFWSGTVTSHIIFDTLEKSNQFIQRKIGLKKGYRIKKIRLIDYSNTRSPYFW